MIVKYDLFLESKKLGRIVFTGSPGTGKTEIIKHLKNEKYHVIPEPSRYLLKKLKMSDKDWYKNLQRNPIVRDILHIIPEDNREAFQQMVEKQNIFNYNRNKNGFFDRSLVDEIGFRKFYKKEISDKLIKDCNKYKYDKVFFFEPWKEIYVKDSERKETYEQSCELSQLILNSYKDFGYNPIFVPKKSIKERVNFILDNI